MTKTRKFLSLLLTPTLVGTVPIVATSCSRKNEVQDNGLTKKQNDVFTMIAILGMQVPPPSFNIINDQEADVNLIYSLIKNNLNDCYEIETVKLRDHKLFTEYITFLDDTNQHHTYTIIYITETQSIGDT